MITGPSACDKCGIPVLVACDLSGTRWELNAEPVVGGDFTVWPVGNPGATFLRVRSRPERSLPPHDMSARAKANWDGRAEAAAREWYVRHEHGMSSEQIVEQRKERTA